MASTQVKDRFEFPLHLDMWPYTVEGAEAAEAGAQVGGVTGGWRGRRRRRPAPRRQAAAAELGAGRLWGGAGVLGAPHGMAWLHVLGALHGMAWLHVSQCRGIPPLSLAPAPAQATPQARAAHRYELRGVVVHSGSAFAGHYYSYIKARWLVLGAVANDCCA